MASRVTMPFEYIVDTLASRSPVPSSPRATAMATNPSGRSTVEKFLWSFRDQPESRRSSARERKVSKKTVHSRGHRVGGSASNLPARLRRRQLPSVRSLA